MFREGNYKLDSYYLLYHLLNILIGNSMKTYIFHRGDKWYPIELKDDKTAIANAKCNPGTTQVTTLDKRVVWPIKMKPSEDN